MISTAKTTNNGWGFGLNGSTMLFTTYGVKSYQSIATGISAGQWHHITAVLDTSNTVSFYLDGILVGTVAHTAAGIADPNDFLQIGASTVTGSSTLTESFNGLIDDLRVYNTALTAAQVAEAVGVSPCSETVLRARFLLGEKSGTITLDGSCVYTLTTPGDTANGGSGVKVSTATIIEGNGATIERNASASQFRVMTTSPAINFAGTTGRITNSIFADNTSGSSGAAIRASRPTGSITILNNTFTDAYHNTFEALLFDGTATVRNNIFDNFKTSMTASGAATVVSEDTNLFSTLDADPQALSGATINRGSSDRTVSSPRFVDPAVFNYHLQASSPAIDLGADMGILTDADGNPRPFGAIVDIGAYEYQGVGLPSITITKSGPPYAAATGSTPFILTIYNEGSSTPVDAIETTTTSNSGLTYETATSQYTYVWKTEKGWANTCRLFTITLGDGSKQEALFKLNK